MKKIFLPLLLIFACSAVSAEIKCMNKSGFINEKFNYLKKNYKIDDPSNTLIFLFNHGDKGDRAAKKDDCPFWKQYIKNVVELSKEDFGAKKNLVYLVNTKPLWGDAYKDKKSKTKWLPFPGGKYPGKTKTEKKIDLTNEIIDKFLALGIKPNNIIISGHSCGGWLTLLYTARHPEKVRGGIAYHPACYGELSAYKIWTEEGMDDYLWDYNDHEESSNTSKTCDTKDRYKWEYACSRNYLKKRDKEISEIQGTKNLRIAVIHNDEDPYGGKTSAWLKNIKSINFIETPTSKENWKINGKSCKAKTSKQWYGYGYGHHVMEAKCMPEYFPQIVKYFKIDDKKI